ncbi:hypothetical protein D3C73_1465450 [compost metagenome]
MPPSQAGMVPAALPPRSAPSGVSLDLSCWASWGDRAASALPAARLRTRANVVLISRGV